MIPAATFFCKYYIYISRNVSLFCTPKSPYKAHILINLEFSVNDEEMLLGTKDIYISYACRQEEFRANLKRWQP